MAIEIPMELELDKLTGLQRRVLDYAGSIGAPPARMEELAVALSQSFCAACLVPDARGAAVFSLERTGGEFALRMRFGFDGDQPPAGLVQELFCPPARRVAFSKEGRKALWAVIWED